MSSSLSNAPLLSTPPAAPVTPIPQSLLSRVISDSSPDLSPPTSLDPSTMRSYASKKLLQLTPRALDTLDSAMSSGSFKERISAASEVLKRSEATRDETLISSQSLPPAFAALFVESLKSLASYLPQPARDVEVHIED